MRRKKKGERISLFQCFQKTCFISLIKDCKEFLHNSIKNFGFCKVHKIIKDFWSTFIDSEVTCISIISCLSFLALFSQILFQNNSLFFTSFAIWHFVSQQCFYIYPFSILLTRSLLSLYSDQFFIHSFIHSFRSIFILFYDFLRSLLSFSWHNFKHSNGGSWRIQSMLFFWNLSNSKLNFFDFCILHSISIPVCFTLHFEWKLEVHQGFQSIYSLLNENDFPYLFLF
jgi:hypothetical protein